MWSLILVYPSFTVPFCTWLLMGFFKAIPRDLEDAAMIDGLSRFGAFIKVVMPISVAGILTAVIFAFTLVTQEFVYGVTFITASSSYTVSVGVPTFSCAGRRLFLGLDDGSLPDRERANCRHLQFLRRSFRSWLHHGRDQVTRETKYALRHRYHVSSWQIVLQKSRYAGQCCGCSPAGRGVGQRTRCDRWQLGIRRRRHACALRMQKRDFRFQSGRI